MNRQGDRNTPGYTNPPGVHPFTGRFRTLSVLCVYEDPLFLDRICRNLEQEGDIFVEISVSVEDALHLMVYVLFDAVITDFTFWEDKPNGFLKAARKQGKQMPFIYFTREQNSGIARDAEQYGRVKYLAWDEASPVVPFDELIRCIHEMAVQDG